MVHQNPSVPESPNWQVGTALWGSFQSPAAVSCRRFKDSSEEHVRKVLREKSFFLCVLFFFLGGGVGCFFLNMFYIGILLGEGRVVLRAFPCADSCRPCVLSTQPTVPSFLPAPPVTYGWPQVERGRFGVSGWWQRCFGVMFKKRWRLKAGSKMWLPTVENQFRFKFMALSISGAFTLKSEFVERG